jgi:uncharacterized protein YjbJ (UPF0337 family)
MNWDQVEGNWKQFKGKMKERWGKLTDSDFEMIQGKRDQMVGRLQERYGMAKDEAEKQLNEFMSASDATASRQGVESERSMRDDWRKTGTGS